MLLVPADKISGLEGMDLLQAAMSWHFGELGVIFIAVILWLFSFTTFIGILFYARSNGELPLQETPGAAQTAYKSRPDHDVCRRTDRLHLCLGSR